MPGSVGICLGATTITIAQRSGQGLQLRNMAHEGRVGAKLAALLDDFGSVRLGLTGRKFRKRLAIPTVSEPEAVELAFAHLRTNYPETDCIVSAGGETFIAYLLDTDGKIREVHSGNKCAAGTREFFLQQIRRMGLEIEEALALAAEAPPYMVAGRCSVFCKSDCTHALNKGIPKAQVVAGLCRMMAGKVVELLKKAKARRVALVGGVSRNRVLLEMLRETCPEVFVPAEAVGFEALGALLWAERSGVPVREALGSLAAGARSFESLPSLQEGLAKVTFHALPAGSLAPGEYLCGLDVGSTTTKAVLVRADSRTIVASAYLRTNGDPVSASRECYRQLLDQLPPGFFPAVVGLGVTGSGRQIAGLHALTDGVVNEIVAHAAAAVHFDPEVETIFEIGGQDAKYTWITNRVASDYAMNEACSAGTGSFLEEACREALGIGTEEIAGLAMQAINPPNFSDQCAAFIGSDIKTAAQEGIGPEDVAAGLVYSICQNYLNRVKGNRPVGRKIFMQGGVCYNQAVPAAMAVLCGQPIVVPPEPGLMGAFGAALEVLRKLEGGLLQRQPFNLAALATREVSYLDPFVCGGGREGCDRKCSISRIVIDGHVYPFGGACSLYDRRRDGAEQMRGEDLVSLREDLVFRKYAPDTASATGPTVGLLPSLFGSTFYPLYAHFFADLGLRVVTPATPDPEGMEATGAAFCHPVLLSHGFLRSLLDAGVEHLFLPHVKNVAIDADPREANCTCPLVQGEPYCLAATFPEEVSPRLLTAVLEFQDRRKLQGAFVAIGKQLGFPAARSRAAFARAWQVFSAMRREMQVLGRQFLASLPAETTAIVLFGRPYNAFSRIGNMGIPHKFTGRAYPIIPHDFLPLNDPGAEVPEHMYWTTGRHILQAASLVQKHPNLFGVFITSFSCGPDSFLLGYFRERMGQKPTLILELDGHTADAGVDTRIEAYLDVVGNYRECRPAAGEAAGFTTPRLGRRRGASYIQANGRRYALTDPEVRVLIPSMGANGTRGVASAFRYAGVDAVAAPPPGREELSLGKAVATCKECLPLLLTVGSLRKYLQQDPRPEQVLLYFMPGSNGPCRFGQYQTFLENYLAKNRITDVALLGLSCENSYAGLSSRFTRRAWQAICIADGLDEIEATVRALALDPAAAVSRLESGKERIFRSLARDGRTRMMEVLGEELAALARFPRKSKLDDALRINLVGEIYVRRDDFSRQNLVERLAERGIVVRTAPLTEWLHYSDYCVVHGLASNTSLRERLGVRLNQVVKGRDQKAIEQQLARSGYVQGGGHHISQVVCASGRLVNPLLATEASLTVGTTLLELGEVVHGVISIGPFGCMPCRIAEAVINGRLASEKSLVSSHNRHLLSFGEAGLPLPFLAIETDGNAFPQLVDARLECFLLAAQRLRDGLKGGKFLPDPAKVNEPLAGQTAAGSRGGSEWGAGALDLECPAEPAPPSLPFCDAP
jgi:predicted CoA-substrate-specific enzyme activase